jgi:hypothetical protein
MLVEHIKRSDKVPAVGTYNPQSPKTQIDIDFSKAPPRIDEAKEAYEREQEKEGDVLLLDPNKPGKRLPDIKFEKQIGRPEEYKLDDDHREELIIEPNIEVVRKKQPYLVTDFGKQIGREDLEKRDPHQDEYYIMGGTEEERLADPSMKRPVVYDFGRPKQRFDLGVEKELAEILQPDELLLDPEPLAKKIKGGVNYKQDKVERFP